jgi:hypothetical protein
MLTMFVQHGKGRPAAVVPGAFCLLFTAVGAYAAPPAPDVAILATEHRSSIAAAFMEGGMAFQDYIVSRDNAYLDEAQTKLGHAIQLINALFICCATSVGPNERDDLRRLQEAGREMVPAALRGLAEAREAGGPTKRYRTPRGVVGKVNQEEMGVVIRCTLLDIMARHLVTTYFGHTWTTAGGPVQVEASANHTMQRKLSGVGLGDAFTAVEVDIKNSSGRDVHLNGMVLKFVILRTDRRQVPVDNHPDLNTDVSLALHQLPDADRHSIFSAPLTVYDGSKVSFHLLVPATAGQPSEWRAIALESALGQRGGSLDSAKLLPVRDRPMQRGW